MSKAAADYKALQKQIWGKVGNYPAIAKVLEPVAEIAADLIPQPDGKAVLEIGPTSGNLAIAAAERGAEVTVLEAAPELIERGSARTEAAGHEVRWTEGDLEELPFDDDSFDAVGSVFGAIFAPRHAVLTGEVCRVTRSGGRVVLTAWAPEGFMGQALELVGKLGGGIGEGLDSPVGWGDPEYVVERFEVLAQVQTQTRTMGTRFDTVLEMRRFWELQYPPLAAARPLLKERGALDDFNQGMMKLIGEFNKSSLGTSCEIDFEYLVILAQPR